MRIILVPLSFFFICLAACGPGPGSSSVNDSDSLSGTKVNSRKDTMTQQIPSVCFLDSFAQGDPKRKGNDFIEVMGQKITLKGRLLSYKYYLDALNSKDPAKIGEGAKTLATCFNGWPDQTRDSAFLVYYKFYYPAVRGFTYECPPDSIMERLSEGEKPASITALTKKLAPFGISMIRGEACYVSIEKPGFLEVQTAMAVSNSMHECITANTLCEKYFLQVNEHAMDIKSGMRSIAEALAATDSVVRKYPGTLAARLSQYENKAALSKFLFGDEVFYVFETDAKNHRVLMPDARAAWENYASAHAATPTGKIIQGSFELLRKNNFILDAKVESQVRKVAGLE